MTDQSVLIPLSQPLGMGQRDKTSTHRDNGGTATGTIGLKALAAKVLHRDKVRDNSGTAALNSCPTADEGVGQTFGPVSLVPADDLDERVAGLSTEPRQHNPEGLLLPTPGRPVGGENDALGEPVVLRDSRRLYRFRAVETASSGDSKRFEMQQSLTAPSRVGRPRSRGRQRGPMRLSRAGSRACRCSKPSQAPRRRVGAARTASSNAWATGRSHGNARRRFQRRTSRTQRSVFTALAHPPGYPCSNGIDWLPRTLR
jgi:hypothetical protein